MLPHEPKPTVAEAVRISVEGLRGGRPQARQSYGVGSIVSKGALMGWSGPWSASRLRPACLAA